jgi:hypothetical protein
MVPLIILSNVNGLCQGCPLSPFIFLLIAYGLSRLIKQAQSRGIIKGLKITHAEILIHLLFVDDVIIFCVGLVQDFKSWKGIWIPFAHVAIGMQLNMGKSIVLFNELGEEEKGQLMEVLVFACRSIDSRLKYLGFEAQTKLIFL